MRTELSQVGWPPRVQRDVHDQAMDSRCAPDSVRSCVHLLSARHWAGGRRMRSESIAALPQSVCVYAWKFPVTRHMRPILSDQAHGLVPRHQRRHRVETSKAEHPSLPWKAYVASREFQNLASELADAVFVSAPASHPSQHEPDRPSSLITRRRPGKAARPHRILAPVIPGCQDALLDIDDGRALAFAA